ncbi:MAG: imidazole glycerol phosphate synthase subunit HisH [Planctomycetes bacterium]|nr:imidazole glycerol phosphate synthase subunit HisH [Planctomycetota bacterium]
MIAIVDYGLGNVNAIENIYRRLGIEVVAVRTASELAKAPRLILPGVGSFDWAMRLLDRSGMRGALDEAVLGRRIPVLGICVGFQMMLRRSDEGVLPGLGWIEGDVRKFEPTRSGQLTRLPHMGWNDVRSSTRDPIFAALEEPMRFYFLHSYYIQLAAPDGEIGTADYQGDFCCAARRDNVVGVQFHPEKSHQWGVGLLRNFAGSGTC